MTVVDTSFLIAFFDADDRRHAAVRKTWSSTNPAVIGPEVLVETLGALKAKGGRQASDAALEDLMRITNVEWATDSDPVGTYRLMRANSGLSYVDAAGIRLAQRRRMDLLTLDDRQASVHADAANQGR